jgi:hypothetical protein
MVSTGHEFLHNAKPCYAATWCTSAFVEIMFLECSMHAQTLLFVAAVRPGTKLLDKESSARNGLVTGEHHVIHNPPESSVTTSGSFVGSQEASEPLAATDNETGQSRNSKSPGP